MSNKNYRIRTQVNGEDKVLKVNLKQGVKTLNILSLEINPEDVYEKHTSDYGVIVGRVLANEAFGVPNVKISVFVPLDDVDENDYVISNEYPFKTSQTRDANGARYNVLPQRNGGAGTFPSKKMVLDNDGCVEVFDKYWKYTTTTNESGDYMIFGVPTGSCQIHYDCDLSDIGIISQHPYDFIAKGYDANLFKSKTKFTDEDLDTAVHIISSDISTYVYPFWGDKDVNKIGITRNDINIDYKFEPSCVFMGSSITDPDGTYIDEMGKPNASNGMFETLATSTGDIEVIRKTQDGGVEELKDNVKGIIDAFGVWCYQIPMNLDRIGTDEFGNRIAINDPNKGIPTRARVRFRISLSNNNTSGGVTAKMLVPCNPELEYYGEGSREPIPSGMTKTGSGSSYDVTYPDDYVKIYEFGSNTPDEHFRDLYWGKVYSVKQYYPRFQYEDNLKPVRRYNSKENAYKPYKDYLLKIDDDDAKEMYNFAGYPPIYSFRQSCISSCDMINGLNTFPYTTMYAGPEMAIDERCSWWFYYHMSEDTGNERLTEKGLHFCFENDWINGCLYFPKFGVKNGDYFGRKNDDGDNANNDKREHASTYDNVYISGRHNFFVPDGSTMFNIKNTKMYWHGRDTNKDRSYDTKDKNGWGDITSWVDEDKIFTFTRSSLKCGIITKKKTILNQDVFYYRCGGLQLINDKTNEIFGPTEQVVYRMLYASDIILLGNLEDIYDHLPKLYNSLPITTATFPPIGTTFDMNESGMSKHCYRNQVTKGVDKNEDLIDVFSNYSYGQKSSDDYHSEMAGGDGWTSNISYMEYNYSSDAAMALLNGAKRCINMSDKNYIVLLTQLIRRVSLYFELVRDDVDDMLAYDIATFINTSRICELDVHNDMTFKINNVTVPTNGIIDAYDISQNENRSAFASMNQSIKKYVIDGIGNRKYISTPLSIHGFDGRLRDYIADNNFNGSINLASDYVDKSYMTFRFGYYDGWLGPFRQSCSIFHYYNGKGKEEENGTTALNYLNGPLYIPKNSFYFYFGLRSGYSALDVLRNNYIGYDEETVSNDSVINISQNSALSCGENGEQYGSITVFTFRVSKPITWTVTQGSVTIANGEENTLSSEFVIDGLLAGRNYKITITDSDNRTFESNFNVDEEAVSVQYSAEENPYENKHELIIDMIDNRLIGHFSGSSCSYDDREGTGCNTGETYYYAGGSGNKLNAFVYGSNEFDDRNSDDMKVQLKFDSDFDSWEADRTNLSKTIRIKFPIEVEEVKISCEVLRTKCDEQDFKHPCVKSELTVRFQAYVNATLELNNIPVVYLAGWSPYEWWSPSNSSDVPDAKFIDSHGYNFNLFDSLNTAHPDQTTTTWISTNVSGSSYVKYSLNRGYKFVDSDTNEILKYENQLLYVSNMVSRVFGGNQMKLKNADDISVDHDFLPIAISPNYNLGDYKQVVNEFPLDTWVFSGDNIQVASIAGDAENEINIPHIVGSNYPRSYDSVTMLKAGDPVDEVVVGYINNETITANFDEGNLEFGVNLFAYMSKDYHDADKPIANIQPTDFTQEVIGRYKPYDVYGYFGVRTVDKRMDYQFVGRTPLLLPSGYDSFRNLNSKAFVPGSVDIDLYGGFRLNYVGDGSSRTLTSYRTYGDESVNKFFGWDNATRETWISSVAGDDIVDYFNGLESDADKENYVKNKSAQASVYDFSLINTSGEKKWIENNAECWLMSQYKKAKDEGMVNSWLEDVGSYVLVGSNDFLKKTEREQKVFLGDYYERKYDGLTAYDAKIYWLKNKAKELEENYEWLGEHEDDLTANTITEFLLEKFGESGDTFVEEEFNDEYDVFSGLTSENAQTYFAEDMFENIAILKYCTDRGWYNQAGTNMGWVKTTGATEISDEYNNASDKRTWIVNKCVDYRYAMLNGLDVAKKYEFVTAYGSNDTIVINGDGIDISKTFFNNCGWVSITGTTTSEHPNYPNADKLRGAIITKFCELADVNASEAQEFAQGIDGFLVSSKPFSANSEWINSQLLSGYGLSLAFYSYLYDELKGEFGPSTNDFVGLLNHVYSGGSVLQRFDSALTDKQYSWIKDKCGDDLADEFKNELVENQYNWFVGNVITECYEFFFGQSDEDKKTWLSSSLLANNFNQLTTQEQEEWVKDNALTWAVNYFNALDSNSEKERWIYRNAGDCELYKYKSLSTQEEIDEFIANHAGEWAMVDFNELSEEDQHDFVLRNSGERFVDAVGSWSDYDKEEWFVEKLGGQMYEEYINLRANMSGETRTKWLHEKSSDVALMEFNSLPQQQTYRIRNWINETFGDDEKYDNYSGYVASAQTTWLNTNKYDNNDHFANANDISANTYSKSIRWNIYNAGSSSSIASYNRSAWVRSRAKTYAKYKITETQNNETLKSWVVNIGKELFYYGTYYLSTTNNIYKNLLSSLASKYQTIAFKNYEYYSHEQIDFVSSSTFNGESVQVDEFYSWSKEKQLNWVSGYTKEKVQLYVSEATSGENTENWYVSSDAENYLIGLATGIIEDIYNHISANTEERDSFIIDLYTDWANNAFYALRTGKNTYLTHDGLQTEDNWLSGSTISGVSATTLSENSGCVEWATAEYSLSIQKAKEDWVKNEAIAKIDDEYDNVTGSRYLFVWKKCFEWARTIYEILSQEEKEAYLRELYAQRTEIGFFGFDDEQEERWIRKIGGTNAIKEFEEWDIDDATKYFLSENNVNEAAFYECETEQQKETLLNEYGLCDQYSAMTLTTQTIKDEYIRKNAKEAINAEYYALTYKDARKYWFIDVCGDVEYYAYSGLSNDDLKANFINKLDGDWESFSVLNDSDKKTWIKTVVGEEAFDEYSGLIKSQEKESYVRECAKSWYENIFNNYSDSGTTIYTNVVGYEAWNDKMWWIYFHSEGSVSERVAYASDNWNNSEISGIVVSSLIREFNSATKEDARYYWLNNKMSGINVSDDSFADSWANAMIDEFYQITTLSSENKEKCGEALHRSLVEKYGGNWAVFKGWSSDKKQAWLASKDVDGIYNNISYLISQNAGDANEVIDGLKKWWIYLNGGDWTLMKFNAMPEKDKRSFVYENGGGQLITGGPQRLETVEGRGDGAKLFDVSFYEEGSDGTFEVSENKITENDINIWDMITDYGQYYDEFIPLYTMPSDIDHVKYSISDLADGDASFNASFTDCSTAFSNGFVIGGNNENLSISYEPGVKVIRSIDLAKYDVGYEFSNIGACAESATTSASTSAFTTICASFAGTYLAVNIQDDNEWGGERYTDVRTDDYNDGIYPSWAEYSNGDISNVSKKAEFAAYVCVPNSTGYSVVYSYSFKMSDAINYDRTQFVCPYGVDGGDEMIFYPMPDIELSDSSHDFKFQPVGRVGEEWEDLPSNSFLIIPTRKIYKINAANTQLKQGVIYNRGCTYYTGSMYAILNVDRTSMCIRVNTPLRSSGETINYQTNSLKAHEFHSYNWHTFGELDELYWTNSENGITVNYKPSRMEFNVRRNNNEITETTVYFSIKNGLRYRMKIYFEDQDI